MSKLELRIMEDRDEPYVQYFVDGRNLAELIREVDRSSSAESMDDVLPLGYQGPERGFEGGDYTIEDTVLGQTARSQGVRNAILFACGCGHAMCDRVEADILVDDLTITIENITFSNRTTSSFPRMSFSRDQVAAEVQSLHERLKAWTRPPPKPPQPPRMSPKQPEPEIHPDQEC